MDRFGRKRTVQIGAAIATVGGILQAAAMNLAMILVGRIISGWAVGLMSMSVPVYQAECAHPRMRGMIVGLTQQMIGIGFIISTWVGYGSRHTSDASSFQWRFPLAFQIIPSALLLVGLIWLPESPRYLIEKDHDEEGMRILRKLHYNGSNEDWIQSEYNEIRATLSAEKAITAPGWGVMFTVPQWRKRLLLGTLVQVFTQLTGISEYPFYWPRATFDLTLTRSSRCHWLLPNHHVQRIGHCRSSCSPRRRYLQLRRTHRQRHIHLLHSRPSWTQEATPFRSRRHHTCSFRGSWSERRESQRHAPGLFDRRRLLLVPSLGHIQSFVRPCQLGLHVRNHAHANPRPWMCLCNRHWQLARLNSVCSSISDRSRRDHLGEDPFSHL